MAEALKVKKTAEHVQQIAAKSVKNANPPRADESSYPSFWQRNTKITPEDVQAKGFDTSGRKKVPKTLEGVPESKKRDINELLADMDNRKEDEKRKVNKKVQGLINENLIGGRGLFYKEIGNAHDATGDYSDLVTNKLYSKPELADDMNVRTNLKMIMNDLQAALTEAVTNAKPGQNLNDLRQSVCTDYQERAGLVFDELSKSQADFRKAWHGENVAVAKK